MGQIFSQRDIGQSHAAFLDGAFADGREALLSFIKEMGMAGSVAEGCFFFAPIQWKTALTSDQLKTPLCDAVKFNVESFEKDGNGKPLFLFDTGETSVLSFSWLAHVLAVAPNGEDELHAILKANPNPLATIFGPDFGDGGDLIEAASKSGASGKKLALISALYAFNRGLLARADVLLEPAYIQYAEAEVKMLAEHSGIDSEQHCLESISWESSFVSNSGIRAPPWRAKEGDLGYVVAKPFDHESMTIMVNTEGYWRIEGPKEGDMSYDKIGGTCRNIVSLIKGISASFAAAVAKQDIWYEQPETKSSDDTGAAALNGTMASTDAKGSESSRARRGLDRMLDSAASWGSPLMTTNSRAAKRGKRGLRKSAVEHGETGTGQVLSGAHLLELDDEDEDDEEEVEERRVLNHAEQPAEYWTIHRLVKFLNSGNQTATIIALCSMRDYDLKSEPCQFAIQDVKGLDILVNLLEAADSRCKVGALQILRDISLSPHIVQQITDLNGINPMIDTLDDEDDELRSLAAATIANCAKLSRNRRKILEYHVAATMKEQEGGIDKLVKLLKGNRDGGDAIGVTDEELTLETCGAMALWSCSKSRSLRQLIFQANAIPLLHELLYSENIGLLIPLVGIIEECAEDESFRITIRNKGMVEFIVNRLSVDNEELQAHCASAIFKCGEDEEVRQIVRENGGLKPLVALLAKTGKEMLRGVTGAIWKCALNPECRDELAEAKAVESLCPLLVDQPEEVLVNVVGALSELARRVDSRKTIRACGGIDQLVKLLTGTNQALLINVTKAVGQCAQDKDNMAAIDKQEGVRLLWSLLKSPTPEVQSGAAWAICPCIELAPDAGEMVRSFVGGLELIVGLLKSEHIEVLASVCAAVANIAKDDENLAVMTDYGVVPMLGRLTPTTDDRLRRHLAAAISQCSVWGQNRVSFGEADAVAPLVKYLRSEDEQVHRTTATALWQLSQHPDNCITMHEAGVVKPLIGLVGSADEQLQEAAAQCISNIRRLALVNELAKHQ